MRATIEFHVIVDVPDPDTLADAGEALKDYLYDANHTRPYDTDPNIIDVTYELKVG